MTVCPQPRCDGHGWVTVLPSYADKHLHRPPAEVWSAMGDTERDAWRVAMEPFRESLAESVYPCRVCHPDAFFKWCEGHYDRHHDAAACDECNPRRRRKQVDGEPASPALPERRDLA